MSEPGPAAVQVVRGVPSAEELAALIAVLCARPAAPAALTGYEAWRARRVAALGKSLGKPLRQRV